MNGQSIFLPAAGYFHEYNESNNFENAGGEVSYWSSNNLQADRDAINCNFNRDYIGGGAAGRSSGRSVRAVYDEPFTTNYPSVEMHTLNDITDVSAVVECEVIDDGGATVTERDIVYDTSEMPTTSNGKIINGSGVGSYACQMTNLEPETAYFVRAYAINQRGVSYSRPVRFITTSPATVPIGGISP